MGYNSGSLHTRRLTHHSSRADGFGKRSTKKANKILFCDTNVLVTQIWSETHFDGYCDPKIIAAVNQVHYDLYLLTGIDIPWEADDLRDRPNDRASIFEYFKIKLKEQKIAYKHIKGDRENRIKQATTAIDSIIL